MNKQFSFILFLLLASTFCFGQEIKTHDIIINKGNDKIRLFPGEKIIIKSITGQVDICPYVKKRKRGGFLGIGRKTVKTLVHNFRKPENYPAQFNATFSSGDLDIEQLIYYKSDVGNLELAKMVSFTIPDPRNCGKSHGGYSFTYIINMDERYNLLSKYFENNLNSSNKILNISDVTNVDSQIINANLKNSNPGKVAYLLYNYISNSIAYSSTEKLKLYEVIVDHISPDCIPMLVDLAKFAEETGRFGLAEDISKKAIKALSNFNPVTYETRNMLADAFNTQANTKFNKNIGLKSKDLTEAASHYSLAAYNYVSIGEKSKSIEAILNVSKTLKKIKSDNSLKLAENSIVQFRDSLVNWESRGGWYYTNPKKPSLIITNTSEVRIDSLSKYKFKLEENTIKGDFQELIFYPGSSLTFVPDSRFDKIEINAIRAAFGSNVSISANGEKLSEDTANHGNDEKRKGIDGENGKSGKELYIKAGVVLLDSLTINTSGSDGQNGGNGFNGDEWSQTQGNNSSKIDKPGERGPGEPGLGGLGGKSGPVSLDFFMMQPHIDLDKIKIVSKSGKTGNIGLYGLKYDSFGHAGERPSVPSEKLATQSEMNAQSNAKIAPDLVRINPISESQFHKSFDIKKRIDNPNFNKR